MARSAKIKPELLTDPDILRRIDAELRDAEQDRDDAAMSVASQYKAAEKRGVNREAFKRARRYAKMSQEKFQDEWRALLAYVPILCADHLAQPDLLEDTDRAEGFADDEAEDVDYEDADDAEDDAADDGDGDEEGTGADDAEGNGADWGEIAASASDEDLLAGGHAFNAGRAAGRRGDEASLNPHDMDSASYALWARGYAKGLAEGPEDVATPAPVEAETRGRGRRSTVSALH